MLGGSLRTFALTAPASSPAAGAKREEETHRGSCSREAGLLAGASGSTISPLPLSDGTNNPTSAMLQLLRRPPRCCPDAHSRPRRDRGSGQIARGVVDPEAPVAGAWGAAEPAMAARTEIATNCFLFRSEKNRLVCAAGSAHQLVAPSRINLLPGAPRPPTGLLPTSPRSLLSRVDLGQQQRPRSPAGPGLPRGEAMATHGDTCAGRSCPRRGETGAAAPGVSGAMPRCAARQAEPPAWPFAPSQGPWAAPCPAAPSTHQPQPSPNQNKIQARSSYSETAALAALGIAITPCSRKPQEQRGITV